MYHPKTNKSETFFTSAFFSSKSANHWDLAIFSTLVKMFQIFSLLSGTLVHWYISS